MPTRQKQIHISASQKLILERIAIRISDKPGIDILDGIPRTDGKKIYIPFSDETLSISDLEGLVAHEGGHIRFQSILDPQIPSSIFPENPAFAQYLLNICEDARIDHILKDIFPGFWLELDILNKRFLTKKMQQFSIIPQSNFTHENLINLLLFLLSVIGTQHHQLIFSHDFSDRNKFKFHSPHLGEFWQRCICEFRKIWTDLTFYSSVIAAKKIFVVIQNLYPKLFEGLKQKKQQQKSSKSQHPTSSKSIPSLSSLKKETQSSDKEDEEKGCDKTQKGSKDSKSTSDKKPVDDIKKENIFLSKEIQDIINKLLKKEDFQKLKTSSGQKLSKQQNKDIKSLKKLKSLLKSAKTSQKKISQVDKRKMPHSSSEGSKDESKERSSSTLGDLLSDIDSELDKSFLRELQMAKEDIQEKLQKLKSPEYYEGLTSMNPQLGKSVILIDSSNFEIKKYESIEDLKGINQIHNPRELWDSIVRKNHKIIQDLRRSFQPIRKSIDIERGKKRGLISNRDLVQVRTSHGLNKRIFKAKSEKSGARLLMIVDESGSMGGRRINIAKEAVVIMAESLKDTRIEYAIVGFSAKARKKILCEKIYKSFSHPLDPLKIGSVGLSGQFYENRDGTSIKNICLNHFKNNSFFTPIAIILSDGQPYHGGTSYVGAKAVEDTRRSIMEIKQMGIQLFAISIDPHAGRYINKIYHQSDYFLVHNLPELPKILMGLVKSMAKRLR
ncbi:MAG: cobaltochelatase CobT-related protein [Promethearchaeota archaeon]